MSKYLKTLASYVEGFLAVENLSHREFAELCGVSNSSISAFLKAPEVADIRFSTVEAIADALKVPAFCLLMSPLERKRWDSGAPLLTSEVKDPWPAIKELQLQFANVIASTASSPEPEESPPDLEGLKAELDLEAYGPPPKKSGRKTGSE